MVWHGECIYIGMNNPIHLEPILPVEGEETIMLVSAYFGFPENVIHGLHDAIEIAMDTGASVAGAVMDYCNGLDDTDMSNDLLNRMDKILQPTFIPDSCNRPSADSWNCGMAG